MTEQRLSGVSVLVADDSDINRVLLTRILERAGARVFGVADGRTAVELVRARGDELQVVLMDLQMPELDGEQATRTIRGELGRARLPIIALSAGSLDGDREHALAAGMDDFIAKPFERQALLERVAMHAERFRAAPAPDAPSAAADEAGDWPEIEGIDAADARARLCSDRALFQSLLEQLARELDEFCGTEREGLAPPRAAERLHKLRGMAGNLGARGFAAAAAELERRARAGEEVELCELRRSAAILSRSLRSAPLHSGAAEASEEPVTPTAQDWRRFAAALDDQDLDALECFPRFSAWLRARLGVARHDDLRTALDDLDFARARALLRDAGELLRVLHEEP